MTWDPLWLSLESATIAMIVSLIVGTGLALLMRWKRVPLPDLVDALISAPLVLPPTVLGYYLLVAMGPDSLIGRGWHAITGSRIIFTFTGAVVAATVALSILAHSSTDIVVARAFDEERDVPGWYGRLDRLRRRP